MAPISVADWDWGPKGELSVKRGGDAPIRNGCYFSPSEGLVVVRMGQDGDPPAGKHHLWNEVARRMSASLTDTEK